MNEKAGASLADPVQYENLFPGFADALKTEEYLQEAERGELKLAREACMLPLNIERDAMQEMERAEQEQGGAYEPKQKLEKPPAASHKPLNWCGTPVPSQQPPVEPEPPAPVPSAATGEKKERKSSLDEFDIELEGMNLDDENIDTSVS